MSKRNYPSGSGRPSGGTYHSRHNRSYRRPLRFEPLEDRRLLAVVTVDTLDDTIDFNDGNTSLREAIFATNLVGGADTIEFAPSLTASGPAKLLLRQGELKITDALTINGPGAELLSIDASGSDPTPEVKDGKGSRVFWIDDGRTELSFAAISGVRLTGGDVNGAGGAIFTVESLALSHVAIAGNSGSGGGGVYAGVRGSGSVTVESSAISGNQSRGQGGGGIYVQFFGDSSATFVDNKISENSSFRHAASGGGGLLITSSGNGDITISGSEFSSNSSVGSFVNGGGVNVNRSGTGSITITDNVFSLNTVGIGVAHGGGLFARHNGSGSLIISDNTISQNTNNGDRGMGGGLYAFRGGTGDAAIINNHIVDNSIRSVGGGVAVIHDGEGHTTFAHNYVARNSTRGYLPGGVGIHAEAYLGTIEIVSNTVIDNSFSQGKSLGGINISLFARATARINDNVVSGNRGGIFFAGVGAAELNNNIVTGNSETGISLQGGGTILAAYNVITGNHSRVFDGGGLLVNPSGQGIITVSDSTIANNIAYGAGGGVYVALVYGGTVEILRTAIFNNHAVKAENVNGTYGGYGGGLAVLSRRASVRLDQVTISGNSAEEDGGGVWVDADEESTTFIDRITNTQNTADADMDGVGSGGGIYVSRGFVELDHTIVAGNIDNSGAAPELAGLFNANRSLIGIGANYLGPLAHNGGPTQTHALLPGSPAINAGDPNVVFDPAEFDQRGAPWSRVYGGRIDIGALEAQPNPFPGDYNFDGVVNAADYTIWRNTLGSATDLRANGDDSNSVIDTADYGVWTANFGELLGPGVSDEERGASVSLAGDLQSPEFAERSSVAIARGTDTPVRPFVWAGLSETRNSRLGETRPPGPLSPARMLALLELLDSLPAREDQSEFDTSSVNGEPSDEPEREAVFAGLGEEFSTSFFIPAG